MIKQWVFVDVHFINYPDLSAPKVIPYPSMIRFLIVFFLVGNIAGAQKCEDGFVGPYPCNHVDLLAHIATEQLGGASTNEVWGWTDPLDGKEYVLLGMSTGVRFYDIEDPQSPIWLGTLPKHTTNSLWRTLRVANNYLFVGSEASNHGMQIFDLTRLRDIFNPPQNFTEDAHYSGFGKCHTLEVNAETGYVYACGTNTYSGGLHIVNIQDPLNPVIAGGYDVDGYTHEVQVVVYQGPDPDYIGRTVAFCYNGNNPASLTLVDVTDPSDATTISITNYPNGYYCHQGWITEDGNFLLMDDELDETSGPFDNTRTLIWNVSDLNQPVYLGDHLGPTAAVDHNQFIIGNLSYQSNYTAGLRILDITNIADLQLDEVAYFDHLPGSNAAIFQGEWMSYPFFESGVVPVSDMYQGLFLLEPNFVEVSTTEIVQCPLVDSLQFVVSLSQGFAGPFEVEFLGLPSGVYASYTIDGLSSPGNFTITLHGMTQVANTFVFEVSVIGSSHRYSRTIEVTFALTATYYSDVDSDGFGTSEISQIACSLPLGYASVAGDCDDNDNSVFSGAPGTGDGIDNNCNGSIEGSEINFCPDLDGNLQINTQDIIIFFGGYDCFGAQCPSDFNDDGIVNVSDLMILLADFGQYCWE